jgi:hypothetical protein
VPGAARKAQPGLLPSRREFGDVWKFNHDEVFFVRNAA